MKIALIVDLFPPDSLAGTEIASYNIAKCLAHRGHEIHVITRGYNSDFPKEYQIDGFFVHKIRWFDKFLSVRGIGFFYNIFTENFFYPSIFYCNVFRCIKKIKPDLIHIQQIPMGFHGFLTKKILGIPYVIYGRGSYLSDVEGFLNRHICRLALSKSDALIVLTADMGKKILRDYSGSVHVIPNGVDLTRFQNISKMPSLEEQDNKNNKKKVILYVGRLHPDKGLQYLIPAMKRIFAGEPLSKLLLIGKDQGEKEKLERIIEELNLQQRIQFIDEVSPEKVLLYMSAADIFVLPSLREGFPNVLLEAMGTGLPVVCTDIDGLSEIIIDGENGFLVQSKNVEQLADKILLLLQDLPLREKFSKNNLDRVREYDLKIVVEKLERIYSDL